MVVVVVEYHQTRRLRRHVFDICIIFSKKFKLLKHLPVLPMQSLLFAECKVN